MSSDREENAGNDGQKKPEGGKASKFTRAALQVLSGAIPYVGGIVSAAAGAWSEFEQERVNRFIENWLRMASRGVHPLPQSGSSESPH